MVDSKKTHPLSSAYEFWPSLYGIIPLPVFASTLIFYLFLKSYDGHWLSWPAPLLFGLLGALFATLVIAYSRATPGQWVASIIVFVPFEFSTTLAPLPQLSPIDYFCAAILLVYLWRFRYRNLIPAVMRHLGQSTFIFWLLFFIYGLLDAYFLGGNIRGLLRWGESLFCYVIAIYALEATDKREESVSRAGLLLTLLGVLISFIAIFQFIESDGIASFAYATFGQRNVMAAFLSLCLPVSAAFVFSSDRPFDVFVRKIGSFFMLTALIVSYSRGAWVGITISIVAVFWYLMEKRLWRISISGNAVWSVLILVGGLISFLVLRSPMRGMFSTSQRPYYWKAAYRVYQKSPLWGMGPGNYARYLTNYMSPKGLIIYKVDMQTYHQLVFWQHLHNLYLQIFVEYGLVGLAFWFIAIGSMLIPAIKGAIRESQTVKPFLLISIFAFSIHNLVDVMTVCSLDLIVMFFLAFCRYPTRTEHH